MKKKQFETIIYSFVGVIAMLLIVLTINYTINRVRYRVDLTQEKAYTFSAGTKAILAKLDTPVKIKFYCSQTESSSSAAVFLKGYAHSIEDLLEEYRQNSNG